MALARTLAVLPFRAFDDASSEWFARGFAEELCTELGRCAALEVVHPWSSFAPRPDDATPAAIGAELGAAHLLDGSVRREGEQLVVAARLIEAPSGRQAWADRFTRPAADLPALQRDIAVEVAGALAAAFDRKLLAEARRRPLQSLAAYECWLRGNELLRGGTVAHDDQARALFERALELDPGFARAWAGISLSHFNEWSCQAWERWDATERLAYDAARRAVDLDDSDHVTQLILGRIHLYRREFDAGERRLALALQLNQSDADALAQAALGFTYLGRHAEAVALVEKAMRLHPRHPEWYGLVLAYPKFLLGEWEECLRLAGRADGFAVDLPAYAAAAHALLGRADEARRSVQQFRDEFRQKILFGRAPEPGEELRWLLHVSPFRAARDLELLIDGFRRAGLVDEAAPATPVARAAPALPLASLRPRPRLRCEGEAWSFRFEGREVRLVALKGFADLATLVGAPGREFHCLELAGRPEASDRGEAALDATARRALEARVRELQEEIDLAAERHDAATDERARLELDAIADSLRGALGIGGKARRVGDSIEKARTAVTWRIRSAIRKLAAALPPLGAHLDRSIRTGTFCSYAPERPLDWER